MLRFHCQRVMLFLLLVIMGTCVVSCSDDDAEETLPIPQIVSNELPRGTKELKILAIGNSYTEDGTSYIQEILDSTDIERTSYSVYTLTRGSSSLEYWVSVLNSSKKVNAVRVAGKNSDILTKEATLVDILSQPWDVIVLQQFSAYAVYYKTYNPSLRILLNAINEHCPNSNVAIAWQMIPAYGKDCPQNGFMVGDMRWQMIVQATQSMIERDGLHIIIPTGTAIQLARRSSLENKYDLTRDNIHLCYGVGRYIAACTWVESLFAPVFGITIDGNTAAHSITDAERNDHNEGFIPESLYAVDDSNRNFCQKIAIQAVRNPFSLDIVPAAQY